MDSTEIELDTTGRRVVDVTADVARFCRGRGDGLLNVLAPHATAGLALMELGSGSEPDLEALLETLIPRDGRYRHSHGSPGHGADHLLPVLVHPTLTLPVAGGEPVLGTWQSVALVDMNPDNNRRRLRLTFLSG